MIRLLALALTLLAGTATWLRAEPDRPNVVFVLSDNQSYYEMGCHGHGQIKTPSIDRLAKESVEFRHFYAPPFCSPSRAAILTGRYAVRSGVHDTIGGRSILHRRETTLADVLRRNGYRTAIFGKWHLGFSYPHRPQDRGFDEVFVHGGGGIGQLEDHFGNTHYDPTFLHNGKVEATRGFSTDVLFDRASSWIEAQGDRPFFCWISTPVTHSPHRGPKALVAELKGAGVEGNVQLFAQVQNLDTNIGRLLDRLEELKLSERTIFVYASDQGMNDRGAPHGGNRLGLAYDPAHHVPFFVRVPGAKPAVCDRLAGMIDFFPTVLDLCGLPPQKNRDGISLKPLLTGKQETYPVDRTLIVQCPRGRESRKWQNASVKTDRWRLVEGAKLYDIRVDPRQENDIAAEHPEVVARLRKLYEEYWKSLPDPESTLSRHLLGARECPEVVLNGMDWYRGSRPWASSHFGQRGGNGAWAVTVARPGRYSIECRLFPREANRAVRATRARVRVGNVVQEQEVDPTATHITFEVELEAGDHDLETSLTIGQQTRGALFVYVASK